MVTSPLVTPVHVDSLPPCSRRFHRDVRSYPARLEERVCDFASQRLNRLPSALNTYEIGRPLRTIFRKCIFGEGLACLTPLRPLFCGPSWMRSAETWPPATGIRTRVASKILEAARQGELCPEQLRQVGRDALSRVPSMWL